MLNVCIERKKARRAAPRGASSGMSDSDGDDEFYDAAADGDSDADMYSEDAAEDAAQNAAEVRHSLWNEPEGRKSKHETLRLLQTGEPLYIPHTQDLVPKPEDELTTAEDDSTSVAVAAAAHAEESHLQEAHKYSCSVTLSDMESFKAANPSGVLEDFVRWYSPRDWVEDSSGAVDQWGQRKGRLSARMQLPENTWVELWGVAQPVPAQRQRRLFDETRSAEGVLSWLEGLAPRALALALLPALAHACAVRVLAEVRRGELLSRLPALAAAERLGRHTVNATREPAQSIKTYERLVSEVEGVERQICTARSVSAKLCPGKDVAAADSEAPATEEETEMVDFLAALLGLGEVPVPGGARGRVGKSIRRMFSEAQKVAQMLPESAPPGPGAERKSTAPEATGFPPADVKEVVMRVVTPRPGPASKPCPQRMYALHRKDEFRLAGCFTRDVTFY